MPFTRKWTPEIVLGEIRRLARRDADLSYSGITALDPPLLRAAERAFGTWGEAVTAAGFDYDAIRRYRRWTRERVIARIRELHAQGADLSWQAISTGVDPALAAAALAGGRFGSWREALQAAGIDPHTVVRYHRWTLPMVHEELRRVSSAGQPLDRATLRRQGTSLLAAVDRLCGGVRAARAEMAPDAVRRRVAAAEVRLIN